MSPILVEESLMFLNGQVTVCTKGRFIRDVFVVPAQCRPYAPGAKKKKQISIL